MHIKKVSGVRGFVPDSWWVFDENGICISHFLNKSDAEEFVKNYKNS